VAEGPLNEFAPAPNPGGGNYLKALASAWYNGTFNTGNLHKGIKSQEDVEKILQRGIHCGDGKVRKYEIGYNSDFDGVLITSDDYYNYSDYDDAGNEVDKRTGKPWGPYEYVEFKGNDLDESVIKNKLNEFVPPSSNRGDGDKDERSRRLRKLLEIAIQVAEEQNVGTLDKIPAMNTIASDDFFRVAVEGILPDITDREYMFVIESAYKTVKQGLAEGRKKKKSSKSMGGYFFPGYGYYGSGEGGGDGGGESVNHGMAEGELDTEFAIFHNGQPVVKFKTRSAAMEFLNMLYEKYPETNYILKPISKNDFYEGEVIQFPKPNNTQSKKTSMTSLQKKRAMNNRDDNKVTPIHQKYTTNANNIHDIYEQMIEEAANAAQQAAIAISMKKAGKKPKKKVNEFLEPSRDNGDNDGDREYELLHKLAAQWWLGDEQSMIKAERTLASMGWEIGEDEGYDDGGVFVVRAGDINGKSYISWPHEDLQLDESITEDVQGDDDVQKIKDFIKWSMKTLHIQRKPKFTLSKNTEQAQKGHHTGLHSGNSIWIYIGNRNLVDIFRTIFHELVHQRQEELNMIKDGDSYPGSPIEALADMMAGKYIKIYGKEHPEIFQ
jgi:hypothetical protein